MNLIYPKKTSLPLRLHCIPTLVAHEIPNHTPRTDDQSPPNSSHNHYNSTPPGSSRSARSGSSGAMKYSLELSYEDDLFVDFVACMLNLDPALRPTAAEALTHPWFTNVDKIDVKVSKKARVGLWGSVNGSSLGLLNSATRVFIVATF